MDGAPCEAFVLVLPGENLGIVVIGEALQRRAATTRRRILRDRMLSGLCVRPNARAGVAQAASAAGASMPWDESSALAATVCS